MIIGINGYSGSGKDTVGKTIQYLQCKNVGKVSLQEVIDHPEHAWWLEEQSGWEIKKFAGKLKLIASLLTGIPEEKFEDQAFKKTYLGPEWDTWGIVRKEGHRQVAVQATPHDPDGPWLRADSGTQVHNRMTVREFLQKLGTEGLRDGLHTNTWVNALMADYKPTDKCTHWEGDPMKPVFAEPNWIITDTRFSNEAQAIKDKGGIVIRVNRPGVEAVNAHPSETGLDNWKFDYVINNDGPLEKLSISVLNILQKEKII